MMLSPIIGIIMNLAAREAIVAEFEKIQPEHLFVGILKFSELDPELIENIFPDSGTLKHIRNELKETRMILKEQDIESTPLRRKIRQYMGRGGKPFKGDVMHRSSKTRLIFSQAQEIIDKDQDGPITVVHLLLAILKDPTPILVKALDKKTRLKVPGEKPVETIKPPKSNYQERDLVDLAKDGRIKSISSRKVQAHALHRYVIHARNKPVLLVAESEAVARECYETMVCEWNFLNEINDRPEKKKDAEEGKQENKEKRQLKAVEINIPRPLNEEAPLLWDNLRHVVRNASDYEADMVVLTGMNTQDNVRQAVVVLNDEIAVVEHSPCIMIVTPISVIPEISDKEDASIGVSQQIWCLANPDIKVPERLCPVMEGFKPESPDLPFFTIKSHDFEKHLIRVSTDGIVSQDEFRIVAMMINELGGPLAQFLGITMGALKGVHQKPVMASVTQYTAVYSNNAKELLSCALDLAGKQPDNTQPGMVALRHIAGAMALLPAFCNTFKVPPASRDDILNMLGDLFVRDLSVMGMGELTRSLKELRTQLLLKIFGQDHAIQTLIEGLFNAEVVAAADTERYKPRAVFLFAGPPGVGKTFLAESGARALGRSFQRFDMSSYSDHQVSVHLLSGIQRSYQGAHEGMLTGFVEKHPNAILLFDEIEKAHLNVIHLFLQILDRGILEDQFTEQNVSFRETVIIFTTNAGKQLYDDPNASGVHTANKNFQRKTILNALETEKDQRTGKPFFPQAICSRLATGYPLMFNHLGVNELERIAAAELKRIAGLLEKQYYKEIEFDPYVAMCIVFREGANTDARTICSQAETFVKSEMFQISRLFKSDRVDSVMEETDKIIFTIDSIESIPEKFGVFLEPREKPKVLLISDMLMGDLWSQHIPAVEWKTANDSPDVLNILSSEEIDIVLLDLWLDKTGQESAAFDITGGTIVHFDHVPAAATAIKKGQELLRVIHEKYPEVPCYLLSYGYESTKRPGVDDELFQACVRSGGARGIIETGFVSTNIEDWESKLDDFAALLNEISRRVYRERKAAELAAQRKILAFETAPQVSVSNRSITVRLRNFHLASAMASDDISEILQDVERPAIGFADIYGADSAKSELEYIVSWLKNPRQFTSMGLRPPRGILLYGHPGTGKTMLARALAGECNVTFIVESATNFVTKYVGSGPENVRNLFTRARRYAPTILFIDEIDAIGKKRGGIGSRAHDETLNAILTEMDGFETSAKKPVIVISATNLVEYLDDALRRRFDREIEVDKPDRAARTAYLEKRLQDRKGWEVTGAVLQRMAGQTANMTIAELERIIELAGRIASGETGIVTDNIIEEALERMRLGDVKGETDPETLLRVARHEAGHCLVGWLRGEKPVQISIVARGKAGGFVERAVDEDKMIHSKPEIEGMIRQAMGGRAAEIIYYGEENGFTTGISSDLKNATHYALQMVRAYGMGEGIGQVAVNPQQLADGPLAIKVMESAEKIIKQQLDQAVDELEKHKDMLDRLVAELMEKNRLTLDELSKVLEIM